MMHEAIRSMLDIYNCDTTQNYTNALRDIFQRLVLMGLWRGKFFEHAAFYGGTALGLLYGLDRFSEDLDFSLLDSDKHFSMDLYSEYLRKEIESYGFTVEYEKREAIVNNPIDSAFLKTDTYKQLIVIDAGEEILRDVHPGKLVKIKLEVDTNPPGGFSTETQYILRPIPIPLRVFSLPDMFAGKLHAVLCRKWGARVKGRDWYDMLWYVGHYPKVNLDHLEARMRQSGDYEDAEILTIAKLRRMLIDAVNSLEIVDTLNDVRRFVSNTSILDAWSAGLFLHAIEQIVES